MEITIVGRGQIVCPYCDPTGKNKTKLGVELKLGDMTQRVCNKHLLSVISTHVDPLEALEPA